MKNKFSISLAFLSLSCGLFSSCNEEPKSKRAFIVSKIDDFGISSAKIECDSVDMLSTNHAKYWIGGHSYNLYAKNSINIVSNPNYVP